MTNTIVITLLVLLCSLVGLSLYLWIKLKGTERQLTKEQIAAKTLAVLHYKQKVEKLSDAELNTYIDDRLGHIRRSTEHLLDREGNNSTGNG